jgi:hypothetical protein
MRKEETAHRFALRTLSESLAGIDMQAQPNGVQKLVASFQGHVSEALAASAQLDADLAELASKRDLIPDAGLARLEREARAEAAEKSKAALHAARQTAEAIKRAGLLGSQPTIEPDRELLGRNEFDTLIGTGDPLQISTRVAQLAERGSREAIGVLNSSYGRAALEAKGLQGRELDETLASARLAIAQTATENSGRHTASELTASQLLKSAGDLDGAVLSASLALSTQNITA